MPLCNYLQIPQIAVDAFDQFVVLDRSFRTRFYYLGRLESELSENINDIEDAPDTPPDPMEGRNRMDSIRRGIDIESKRKNLLITKEAFYCCH